MKTLLWNVTYNRKWGGYDKGYTFVCKQWPYQRREANRAVQVAADDKKKAEIKIRKELGLPDDVELRISKANNFIIV